MKKLNSEIKFYIFIGIISAIMFVIIFGFKVLNPVYDSWLYTGYDLNQHYLGWRAFRQSAWHFPIGLMDGLNYPDQVSIIFTDSIPLFAIFFKVLSPILPETFQYFGLWGLFSFVMSGVFSAKIFYQYSKSKVAILCSVILMLLQPVMLWKMFRHTALAGHWILILAFYLLYFKKNSKWYYPIIIAFLAANVHVYFLLMCGILMIGFAINEWIKKSFLQFILPICLFCITAFFVIGVLGGFSGGNVRTQEGLGEYGLNLLGFINPGGCDVSSSCILPDLPIATKWADEGFSYIGLGGIFLVILEGILLVVYRKKLFVNKKYIGLFVCFLVAFLFALSPRWCVGSRVILEIPLPRFIENVWSVFRATGRVSWVLIYGLLLFGIAICFVCLSQKICLIILVVLMSLQIVDIHNVIIDRHNKWSQTYTYEDQTISYEELSGIMKDDIKHLYYISDCNIYEMYGWTKWALDNDITTNDFYFARSNKNQTELNLKKAIEEKNKSDMFVLKNEDQDRMNEYQMKFKNVGKFYVGTYEE